MNRCLYEWQFEIIEERDVQWGGAFVMSMYGAHVQFATHETRNKITI